MKHRYLSLAVRLMTGFTLLMGLSACQSAAADPPPATVPPLVQSIRNSAATISLTVPEGWRIASESAAFLEVERRTAPDTQLSRTQYLSITLIAPDPTQPLDEALNEFTQYVFDGAISIEERNGRPVAHGSGLLVQIVEGEEIPVHLEAFAFVAADQQVILIGIDYDRPAPRLFEAILDSVIITPS